MESTDIDLSRNELYAANTAAICIPYDQEDCEAMYHTATKKKNNILLTMFSANTVFLSASSSFKKIRAKTTVSRIEKRRLSARSVVLTLSFAVNASASPTNEKKSNALKKQGKSDTNVSIVITHDSAIVETNSGISTYPTTAANKGLLTM